MSSPLATGSRAVDEAPAGAGRASGARRSPASFIKPALLLAALLVALALPLYVEEFWLRTGFAVAGAAIGAIGLNLLVGTAGQLSLAHAFFLAVGATSYVYISGSPGGLGVADLGGLGLPPVIGMVVGVLLAGLAGLAFSPIAARLRGIYLGVASLALVFIGIHLLNTLTPVTGGVNGRSAPKFSLFGFTFSSSDPQLFVLNVPFREAERLWYLGLVLAVAAFVFARNILRGRPGRALQTARDSEVAAAVMGVHVQGYKARIFMISSMYAGLSGVMLALSVGSIAPETFGLELSILYLAMIVLGGLGSVGGAALGAAFVVAMPLIFQRYAAAIPFVGGGRGDTGIAAGEAARFLFGIAIILVILFEPAGLAGFAQRFKNRGRRRGARGPEPVPGSPSGPTSPDPSHPPAQGSTTT